MTCHRLIFARIFAAIRGIPGFTRKPLMSSFWPMVFHDINCNNQEIKFYIFTIKGKKKMKNTLSVRLFVKVKGNHNMQISFLSELDKQNRQF